jgi:hypothetical protein
VRKKRFIVQADLRAPLRFLRTGYKPDDWIAVFLKSYGTGETAQRVVPLSLVTSLRFQAWLRSRNAARWNIYVSVNVLTAAKRSRTRDAVRAIRHVFLEADQDARGVLDTIATRSDLPPLSYVIHSSPNRAHMFWRVAEFTVDAAEALQKRLARELQTDQAATPCTQMTRLPGFFNHKYQPGPLVTAEYRCLDRTYAPSAFPTIVPIVRSTSESSNPPVRRVTDSIERARRYLNALPPAIAGEHGDLHTFRVCCRLVRGFALPDADALKLLYEWNARCEPPWSERELTDKVRRARRYGREPLAGLLEGRP